MKMETKTEESIRETEEKRERIALARDFLCGYQLSMDMLNVRRYERKRAKAFDDECDCEEILMGNEAVWRARMFDVGATLSRMRNGREKLILYYHYVKGESIEHTADLLGVSRRTGYRLHERGLLVVGAMLERRKKTEAAEKTQ